MGRLSTKGDTPFFLPPFFLKNAYFSQTPSVRKKSSPKKNLGEIFLPPEEKLKKFPRFYPPTLFAPQWGTPHLLKKVKFPFQPKRGNFCGNPPPKKVEKEGAPFLDLRKCEYIWAKEREGLLPKNYLTLLKNPSKLGRVN